MSDAETLTRVCEAQPDEDAPAAMLLDELVGSLGLDHLAAAELVKAARRRGRDARDIPAAAALLEHDTRSRSFLRTRIRRALYPSIDTEFVVFIVGGDSAPHYSTRAVVPGADLYPFPAVTVGAGWILQVWRTEFLDLARKRLERRRRLNGG